MSKVLIIEDEKAMSDLIAIKFKVEGFEVEQAFSLAEAKQKIEADGATINAILSDYLLPDGNSVDFLTEVKNNPQTAQIPIIVMTNYVEDVNLEKAKSLGVSEVIVKYQVVPAQMVDKIKNLIGGGGMVSSVPAQAPAAPQIDPVGNPVPAAPTPAPVPQPTPIATPTPAASIDPTTIPSVPPAPASDDQNNPGGNNGS